MAHCPTLSQLSVGPSVCKCREVQGSMCVTSTSGQLTLIIAQLTNH
uniref:Uncharacterized protein n=1 Tax=Anguilla anguilla TaxID=7936 RepID=A0A0E9PXZ1_ANGAN